MTAGEYVHLLVTIKPMVKDEVVVVPDVQVLHRGDLNVEHISDPIESVTLDVVRGNVPVGFCHKADDHHTCSSNALGSS